MSFASTANQLVATSPVAKRRSIEQSVRSPKLDLIGGKVLSQLEYRVIERCRSPVFLQTTWITICWKVIIGFFPDDQKKPTPALSDCKQKPNTFRYFHSRLKALAGQTQIRPYTAVTGSEFQFIKKLHLKNMTAAIYQHLLYVDYFEILQGVNEQEGTATVSCTPPTFKQSNKPIFLNIITLLFAFVWNPKYCQERAFLGGGGDDTHLHHDLSASSPHSWLCCTKRTLSVHNHSVPLSIDKWRKMTLRQCTRNVYVTQTTAVSRTQMHTGMQKTGKKG